MAVVCFLFANEGFVFLEMFKDNVLHGFDCLPLISRQFGPRIRKILVTVPLSLVSITDKSEVKNLSSQFLLNHWAFGQLVGLLRESIH